MAKSSHIVAICLCAFLCATAHASTEYNRYLAQLFQKYGNGGTITFEGLEHLMYSLGLGHIEFEPTHTIAEHRPEGYSNAQSEVNASDANVRNYFEQQSKGLLRNGSDEDVLADVQLAKDSQKNETELKQAPEIPTIVEFRDVHDPKHRHPRENGVTIEGTPLPPSATTCLSPKSLLALLVDHNDLHKHKVYRTMVSGAATTMHDTEEEYNEFINSVRITPKAFMKLCPALLAQIDNGVCVRPAPLHLSKQDRKDRIWNAWIYASISMFVLSACGLLGILLVPLMKTMAYQEVLKFLVAIAVGTLSGDALMHLLPHALFKEEQHEHALEVEGAADTHGHNNEAALLCGCTFLAALFMYCLENLLPLLKGDGSHSHGHSHGHSHSAGHSHAEKPSEKPALADPAALPPRELNVMLQESKLDQKTPERPLTPVAFMVIIGDGLHNLTDGLAIGAAFASDPVTGLATAFAVLCHELPHELGDFALLLQTGVSIRRAVYMNIVSSVLSFVGMAIGLLIAGIGDGMTQWIYAATAGSFLYIAFADLVPTMSVAHNPEMARDVKGILIQIVGILLGGLLMLVIALNEHDLEGLFRGF